MTSQNTPEDPSIEETTEQVQEAAKAVPDEEAPNLGSVGPPADDQ